LYESANLKISYKPNIMIQHSVVAEKMILKVPFHHKRMAKIEVQHLDNQSEQGHNTHYVRNSLLRLSHNAKLHVLARSGC
jgi:hypothetical protein